MRRVFYYHSMLNITLFYLKTKQIAKCTVECSFLRISHHPQKSVEARKNSLDHCQGKMCPQISDFSSCPNELILSVYPPQERPETK